MILDYLLEGIDQKLDTGSHKELDAEESYQGIKGKFETYFKVNGESFIFKAESTAGSKFDAPTWNLIFSRSNASERLDGNTPLTPEVVKAFVEAVQQFVADFTPVSFYTVRGGEQYNNIIDGLKKVIKNYNSVDESDEKSAEDLGAYEKDKTFTPDVMGNKVGRVIWTKAEIDKPYPDFERKQGEFQTKYDKPEEMETPAAFKGIPSTDKFTTKAEEAYGKFPKSDVDPTKPVTITVPKVNFRR